MNRLTNEVVATSDNNNIRFGGGPWSESDENGPLFIWVENTNHLTKAQKMNALNMEYEPQRLELERYLNLAINRWQDEAYAGEIRAELDALDEEYNQKAEAIWNA
jgi:hypothetical protein